MDNVGRAIDLVDRYGVALAGLILFAIVIGVLGRYIRQLHRDAIQQYKEALEEERQTRKNAEFRLASNNEALREATVGFRSALRLMERLAGHTETEGD